AIMPVTLSVALFGALGAVCRFGVDRFIERYTATVLPLSTFAINVTGCLLAGAAVGGLVDRFHEPTWLTFGVVTGFLGAYTTFSMFAYETHDLIQEGHLTLAATNVIGSAIAGVTGV